MGMVTCAKVFLVANVVSSKIIKILNSYAFYSNVHFGREGVNLKI